LIKRYFSLCLITSIVIFTTIARAEAPLRHFESYKSHSAGLVVYKPGSPAWNIDLDSRPELDAIILSTPDNYYPPTSIEIHLSQKFEIQKQDLNEVALVITNKLRKTTGAAALISNKLKSIQYGQIDAVTDNFDIAFQNQNLSIRHVVGRMPSGHVIIMMATTPKDQIDAIEFMLSKIYSNLKEI